MGIFNKLGSDNNSMMMMVLLVLILFPNILGSLGIGNLGDNGLMLIILVLFLTGGLGM